ncbi:hypothetical protein DL93DRAFT_2169642 [Clavulina sp. PMI_390]|nr:hypothetical protein DL93DRAFT_2169642 [Clavulina sp. PMI_390]
MPTTYSLSHLVLSGPMSAIPGSTPCSLRSSFLIGVILSSILFGMVSIQTRLYWKRFPNDLWVMKTMVAFLWAAQLAEVGIASSAIYEQINEYRRRATTPHSVKSSNGETLQWEIQYWSTHLVITAFVVQAFFAYRLWALSRHRIYAFVIGLLIVVNMGLGVGEAKNNYQRASGEGALKSPHHFQMIIALTALSAGTNLALAVGVVITLRKQRTGFVQTDRIVNWIILYGIASGVVTSIFAIAILIATMLGDGDTVVGAGVPFGGVYIASAFAHLHSRTTLRSHLVGEHCLRVNGDGTWPSSLDVASRSARPSRSRSRARPSITAIRTSVVHHSTSDQLPIQNEGVKQTSSAAEDPDAAGPCAHPAASGRNSQSSQLGSLTTPQICSSSNTHEPALPLDITIPTRICMPPTPRFNPSTLFAKGRERPMGWK